MPYLARMANHKFAMADEELHADTKSPPTDTDVEVGDVQVGQQTKTKRGLRSRHAQMLAIGGTIGTGLFVGAGQALAAGGPAFLFSAYVLMTFLVFGMVTSTAEMAAYLPVEGVSMAYFGDRFVSPSLGFVTRGSR